MHRRLAQAYNTHQLTCPWLQPELHGFVPVTAGAFEALQQDPVQWSNSLKQCAAVCNSLNLVNRQEVVGDLADFTAFKACEARFLVSVS